MRLRLRMVQLVCVTINATGEHVHEKLIAGRGAQPEVHLFEHLTHVRGQTVRSGVDALLVLVDVIVTCADQLHQHGVQLADQRQVGRQYFRIQEPLERVVDERRESFLTITTTVKHKQLTSLDTVHISV